MDRGISNSCVEYLRLCRYVGAESTCHIAQHDEVRVVHGSQKLGAKVDRRNRYGAQQGSRDVRVVHCYLLSPDSRRGATISRVWALGTTGTISNVTPMPRQLSTQSWSSRRSSHSIS